MKSNLNIYQLLQVNATEPKQEVNDNRSRNSQETIQYYVEDEDGWTNLRSEPKGKIIKRVNNFELGKKISQNGDWIQLKFDDKSVGYIHKSRLVLAP